MRGEFGGGLQIGWSVDVEERIDAGPRQRKIDRPALLFADPGGEGTIVAGEVLLQFLGEAHRQQCEDRVIAAARAGEGDLAGIAQGRLQAGDQVERKERRVDRGGGDGLGRRGQRRCPAHSRKDPGERAAIRARIDKHWQVKRGKALRITIGGNRQRGDLRAKMSAT